MHKPFARRPLGWLFLILLVLTLYRGWVLVHNALPLYFDEAYYFGWAQQPDWGYYSKPPMVAWIIWLTTHLGDAEFYVKLGSLLLHPATALVLFALGRRMFDEATGFKAGVLFASLPLVGFNSLFITTDAPLFFFWGLAALCLWNAVQQNRWRDWLLTGTFAGLGLLSKFSMGVFAPSVALLLCLPAYRAHWRNPKLYVAGVLAGLVYLPNFVWNARHAFVSFHHTAEISHLDQGLFHLDRLAEFFFGQFGAAGPISFAALLLILLRRSTWRDSRLGFLAALTVPFLAVICLQAFLARAYVNWAAPTYFAGTLLVAACWQRGGWRKLFWAAVALNLTLLSGFYHYRDIAQALGKPLLRKQDPYNRVLGWPELGRALSPVLAAHPGYTLVTPDRGDLARLIYYVQPHPFDAHIWNPAGYMENHYHMVADARQLLGRNLLYVSQEAAGEEVSSRFARWQEVAILRVRVYADWTLRLHVYAGDGFKGYR